MHQVDIYYIGYIDFLKTKKEYFKERTEKQ